jgi:hypothetical protein
METTFFDYPPATLCQPASLCEALLAGVAFRAGMSDPKNNALIT